MQLTKDLSRIVVPEADIQRRIRDVGAQITESYRAQKVTEVTAVCVTNGAIIFAADLLRNIGIHCRIDCIRVSSYQDQTRPVTAPQIADTLQLGIADRQVMIIDDVLDTGKTLGAIQRMLLARGPASLKTTVLLRKPTGRACKVKPDFVGFDIPDEFVVGYGLDFAERYRNLPCIGILNSALQNPPVWQ